MGNHRCDEQSQRWFPIAATIIAATRCFHRVAEIFAETKKRLSEFSHQSRSTASISQRLRSLRRKNVAATEVAARFAFAPIESERSVLNTLRSDSIGAKCIKMNIATTRSRRGYIHSISQRFRLLRRILGRSDRSRCFAPIETERSVMNTLRSVSIGAKRNEWRRDLFTNLSSIPKSVAASHRFV